MNLGVGEPKADRPENPGRFGSGEAVVITAGLRLIEPLRFVSSIESKAS